jgi:hypothetical protein
LGDGVLAVAALDDFEAGAVEAQRAFGHEQNFVALVFTEADAWNQVGTGILIDAHGLAFSG